MGLRRKGRELAIQTMYSISFYETGDDLKDLELINEYKEKLEEMIEHDKVDHDSAICEFAEQLLDGTIKHLPEIDAEIKRNSINWSFEKIALMDRSVLRVAVYELMFSKTAHPIIMDEAIEISKKFCAENSKKFINGLLNAVSKEVNE